MGNSIEVAGPRGVADFARNWLPGGVAMGSARRRLMAVLRLAHKVLGFSRRRLGLGGLAAGNAAAVLLALGVSTAASPAWSQNIVQGTGAQAFSTETTTTLANLFTPGNCLQNNPSLIPCNSTTAGINYSNLAAYSTVIGNNAKAGVSGTNGGAAVAIGDYAQALGVASTAVGMQAQASGRTSVAFGIASYSSGYASLAMMRQSAATGNFAAAIGSAGVASGNASLSMGHSTLASGDQSIAIGSSQKFGASIADAAYDAATNTQATGTQAIALGASARAGGSQTIALGANSRATGTQSISIGMGNVVSGDKSGAIGDPTTITGTGTYSLGNDNGTVGANQAGIFGNNNTLPTGSNNSRIVGNSNTVNSANVMVMGNNVTVATGLAGAVVLGDGSTVASATAVPNAVINGKTYNFAGGTATGGQVVSVGSASLQRQIQNVAAGRISATSTDAVNGSQLFRTNQAVGELGSAAVKYNWTDANGNGVVDAGEVDTTRVTLNPAGAGPTTITNLADGAVNAGSSDAVNGSQLFGVADSVAEALGTGAVVNPDGTVTGPIYNIQGGEYATVYDGFDAVDKNLTTINNTINGISNGGGIKYFHTNSSLADSLALGTDSTAIGPVATAAGAGAIAIGNSSNAQGEKSIAIGPDATASDANSVALGAGSATAEVVATAGTTIAGAHYDFAGAAPVGTVSIGSAGNERTLTNLAAGRLSESSTDAVNGSQLYATNQAIDGLAGGIQELDNNVVKYDVDQNGNKLNSVTLAGGDPNQPVLLANVAAGRVADDSTEAVNGSQLKKVEDTAKAYTETKVNWAIDQANTYTDQEIAKINTSIGDVNNRFDRLSGDIRSVRKEARQAAAVGLAAASLRYDDRPGKLSVAMGGAAWRDEGALAFGLGYTNEDQNVRANISGAWSGDGVGVAAGLSFTLN